MTHYLTFVKDSLGNNYLGIQIDQPQVEPFLNQFKELLSETDFAEYTKNQQNRDSGHYHITVINVMDFNRISKQLGYDKFLNNLEEIFKYPIDDLKMLDLTRGVDALNNRMPQPVTKDESIKRKWTNLGGRTRRPRKARKIKKSNYSH